MNPSASAARHGYSVELRLVASAAFRFDYEHRAAETQAMDHRRFYIGVSSERGQAIINYESFCKTDAAGRRRRIKWLSVIGRASLCECGRSDNQ
jgi:hypothetical protein